MIEFVSNFLEKNIKDIDNSTIAVAYSTGIDSQVMLHIANSIKDKLGFKLCAIHINYNLRGGESLGDRDFAINTAKEYDIDIYIKDIDGSIEYNSKNLQNEARDDRYRFFLELYNKKVFDYILIAHNKDDLVETYFYRILKGTGTSLYKALPKKRKYILRPLLNFSRKDIEKYAFQNNISYREDSSNSTNKYSRNKIRNIIFPMCEEINSKYKDNILNFVYHTYEETYYLRKKVKRVYKKINIDKNSIYIENIGGIILRKILIKFLYFNDIEITEKRINEIMKIINSKKKNIHITLDNKVLIKQYSILKIVENIESQYIVNNSNIESIYVDKDGVYTFNNKKIIVKTLENSSDINYKDKLYIKYSFPFILRQRKDGDFLYTYPNNQKQYIRKIFINLKLTNQIRNTIPIIESATNNEILAIYLEPYAINKISFNSAIKREDKKIISIEYL